MSQCPRCQACFACGMVDDPGAATCWCTALPKLSDGQIDRCVAQCYCPVCLQQMVAEAGERMEPPAGRPLTQS